MDANKNYCKLLKDVLPKCIPNTPDGDADPDQYFRLQNLKYNQLPVSKHLCKYYKEIYLIKCDPPKKRIRI